MDEAVTGRFMRPKESSQTVSKVPVGRSIDQPTESAMFPTSNQRFWVRVLFRFVHQGIHRPAEPTSATR